MSVLFSVAFLVGIFSTCSSAPSQPPVNQLTLTFDLNGISHTETRKVEGSIATLTDAIDGFLVVLDYERNIFMFKNLTSQTCSFSRLDIIPVTKDVKEAIFVEEVTETSLQESGGQEAGMVLLEKVGEIPVDYVRLTNDVTVAESCSLQPSYWLKPKGISRQRRYCYYTKSFVWVCPSEEAEVVKKAVVKVIKAIFSWFG